MSEIKRVPFAMAFDAELWSDWDQQTASDLLKHLQSGNVALQNLRDALSRNSEPTDLIVATHA